MSSSAQCSRLSWSCVVAAAIGCQALVSSALPRQRVVVMLPSASADATLRDRFLQGYAVGEATVRACGHPVPMVRWMALQPDQSPLEQLPRHSDQHLVVAPPSADLRAFSDLSQQNGLSVLLPCQRGESIYTLRGLKGREKLWPLVPSLQEDVKATVEATLKAG
jgi:neutral amino acid transport system substrate-binding protein